MTSNKNENDINGLKNLKYNRGEEVISISCEIIPNSKTDEIIRMCKDFEKEVEYSNSLFDILVALDNSKKPVLRYIPNNKGSLNTYYKFSNDELKKIEKICNEVKKEIGTKNIEKELFKQMKFIDNVEKNQGDLLFAKERVKNEFEKDETMTFEEFGRQVSMDIANVMLECGYSSWVFFKCENFENYKKQAKEILTNDNDIDDVAKMIGTTYEELIKQIDNAQENKEYVDMFKVNDFYCCFAIRTCR